MVRLVTELPQVSEELMRLAEKNMRCALLILYLAGARHKD